MISRSGNKTDIEQRFGYKESGTFRCAYGNEKPLLVILAAVTAVIAVSVLLFIASLIEGESALLMYAMLLVIVESVIIFAAMSLAKFILYGKECFYHADEQKLSVERAGKYDDFFYMNIMCVRYDPLVTLGRQRGFIVTITTRKSTVEYKYIFRRTDVVMSPEKTPFAILEERAGLKTYTAAKAPSEEPVDAPQHTPSYSRSPDATAPEIAPHTEEDEITAKGTFRVPHKYELTIFIVCLGLGAVVSVFSLIAAMKAIEALIAGAVFVLLDIAAFRVLHRTELKYIADGREFRISDSIGIREVIYFCDVERVEYKPYKLLWMDRGFKVSVVTKYRTITYKYLFLINNRHQKPEDTPFHHIERMVSGANKHISISRDSEVSEIFM